MKPDWMELLKPEFEQEYFRLLERFLDAAYAAGAVYPPRKKIFSALELTGYAETRVLLLGQDPYHGERQSHGLAFSVADQTAKFPPSLRNIFKELEADLGAARTRRDLTDWAGQGVLLLNTVLTVGAGKAGSHRARGWERFTDAVIGLLSAREDPVIFLLWGGDAQKKIPLIAPRHPIVTSAHPSPLSARKGFFGSKPFSRINGLLRESGKPEILWGDPG